MTSALVKLLVKEEGSDTVRRAAASRAAQLAQRHALRGFDVLQLAAAVELPTAGEIFFACWDDRLNLAAARERLAAI